MRPYARYLPLRMEGGRSVHTKLNSLYATVPHKVELSMPVLQYRYPSARHVGRHAYVPLGLECAAGACGEVRRAQQFVAGAYANSVHGADPRKQRVDRALHVQYLHATSAGGRGACVHTLTAGHVHAHPGELVELAGSIVIFTLPIHPIETRSLVFSPFLNL